MITQLYFSKNKRNLKNCIFGRKQAKMTDSQKVDAFIEKQTKWKEKLIQLRNIFQKTELKEEVKWGKPTYTLDGKLVVGMADFKNHMALWFHQGVFLKDETQQTHQCPGRSNQSVAPVAF